MPRPDRVFVEGGVCHVYNRFGRGEHIFGLDVELNDLRSRRRDSDMVEARELLMLLGVGRYGMKLKDLEREIRKSPDGMTKTIARAARRRKKDERFRTSFNDLDQTLTREK